VAVTEEGDVVKAHDAQPAPAAAGARVGAPGARP
jgi:hypothetical protein